ncbi:MAG: DUF721 domain-containing protein [Pyrinomonadaceae bacterium]
MRAIFQALPGLLDDLKNAEALEAVVFAMWPRVAGEHLRERSRPVRFDDSTLYVAVADAAWKREFKEYASEIVFKLNRSLASSIVERIEIMIDPKAFEISGRRSASDVDVELSPLSIAPSLKKASGNIGDEKLRKHFLEAAAVCIDRRDSK